MRIMDIMKPNTRANHSAPNIKGSMDTLDITEDIFGESEIINIVDENGAKIGEIKSEILRYIVSKNNSLNLPFIMNFFDEAIVVLDADGRIFYANQIYSKILGVPVGKILGKYIQKVEEGAAIIQVLEKKAPVHKEKIYIKTVDKYVSVKMYPFFKNGSFEGAFSIFKDVTELNNLNKEVKRITSVAEEFSSQIEAMKELDKLKVVGKSPKFVNLVSQALVVAKTDAMVLIRGENGVGKEVITKIIHNNSDRKDKPFITVNCAAIPENLIESELFGYEEGSFTGAKHGGRIGKFQLAEGGTLFLDEIGDMPLVMQSKLLRVLQEKEIEKIGREKNISVDVRVIAATNQPLEEMIQTKQFRMDLYYRLNVISFDIPPLRERGHDVILLANHFLEVFNKRYNKKLNISPRVYQIFGEYQWPGNVRELQNCIEHAVIMCTKNEITENELPIQIKESEIVSIKKVINQDFAEGFSSLKEAIDKYEKKIIIDTMNKSGQNRTEAMKLLGLSRRTFYRKLQEHHIE